MNNNNAAAIEYRTRAAGGYSATVTADNGRPYTVRVEKAARGPKWTSDAAWTARTFDLVASAPTRDAAVALWLKRRAAKYGA